MSRPLRVTVTYDDGNATQHIVRNRREAEQVSEDALRFGYGRTGSDVLTIEVEPWDNRPISQATLRRLRLA